MIQVKDTIKINDVTQIVHENSPSFSGIVNQECKGKLWVDQIHKPTIAIAESYAVGSFAFLGANTTEEDFLNLKGFLDNELFPFLNNNGYHCFEFSIESENLENSILELFQDKAIQTEEVHRKKGLAYAMAIEFIKDCLRNELTPQWDCVESNTSAYRMAMKLGFEKINENTVYWFDI